MYEDSCIAVGVLKDPDSKIVTCNIKQQMVGIVLKQLFTELEVNIGGYSTGQK